MRSIISSAILLPAGLALFFLLFILLARELSPDQYGEINFIFSVSSFIGVLLGAGLPIATTKFVPKYLSKNDFNQASAYFTWGMLWAFSTAIIISLLLFIFSYFSPNEALGNSFYYLAITIPPIIIWQWQRYASLGFDFVATAVIPRDIIYPAICILGLYLLDITTVKDSLLMLNSTYLLVVFAGIVTLFLKKDPSIKVSTKNLSLHRIKEWHRISFPMVLSLMIQLGLNNWDLIILGLSSTMENTGKYAVATRIAMLISLSIRVFDTAISQKISHLYSLGDIHAVKSMFHKARLASSFLGLLGFVILVLFSKYIIALFGNGYEDIQWVLLILATGQLMTSLTGPVTSTLNMIGEEKFVAKSLLKWSLISLALNLLLIPFFSIYGAAAAFFISTISLRIEQFLKLNKNLTTQTNNHE